MRTHALSAAFFLHMAPHLLRVGIPINVVDYVAIAKDPDFKTYVVSLVSLGACTNATCTSTILVPARMLV